MSLLIHNYPWLDKNAQLLRLIEESVLAHGLSIWEDCKRLHALLLAGEGERTYGDVDFQISVLSEAQLAQMMENHPSYRPTAGLRLVNHAGSHDQLFLWADNDEKAKARAASFAAEHPEDVEYIQQLLTSRQACFHIREWDTLKEIAMGREHFLYGDSRDEGYILTLRLLYGEWDMSQLPHLGRDVGLLVNVALTEHEQDAPSEDST